MTRFDVRFFFTAFNRPHPCVSGFAFAAEWTGGEHPSHGTSLDLSPLPPTVLSNDLTIWISGLIRC